VPKAQITLVLHGRFPCCSLIIGLSCPPVNSPGDLARLRPDREQSTGDRSRARP
jgi:hypothetical protein